MAIRLFTFGLYEYVRLEARVRIEVGPSFLSFFLPYPPRNSGVVGPLPCPALVTIINAAAAVIISSIHFQTSFGGGGETGGRS